MCGIAGALSFDGAPVDQRALRCATDALAHRGRDSAAVACGGPTGALSSYPGIGLGHRRLSIIDLSPESGQPMSYADGRLWITYNGELYNYEALRTELVNAGAAFRTQSDTEVVLAAYATWGEACLRRFNGIFAFAIWDERDQSLLCVRDHLGVKPFYYVLSEREFRFASEAQALVRGRSAALSPHAIAGYLLAMYVPANGSMFEGVRKLPPGRLLRVRRNGHVEERAYWSLPVADETIASTDAAVAAMQHEIDRAVGMQLRSDVPVGALLSGGFDSGMVVASAARAGVPLHTYSVGFADADVDELPIARALATRCGMHHHERVIQGEEVIPLLDRAIACLTEPLADSAIVPTYVLSEMAASDGVRVLLSGTGGDEVFAGYTRYVGTTWKRRLLLHAPGAARRGVAALIADPATAARLRHRGLDMLIVTGGSPRLARQMFDDDAAFAEFLRVVTDDDLPRMPATLDPLHQHMQFDLQVYLPDLLLLLLDQLTMAHTVEGRVPLLDIDLVARSFSLPPSVHANRSEAKRLMRQMARDRLDPRTLTAKKQGFSGPVARWIADNTQVFRDRVFAVRDVPGLERVPVEALWNEPGPARTGRWPTEMFSLFCLSTWYQAHARR